MGSTFLTYSDSFFVHDVVLNIEGVL